jgi:hypothetical protein
MRSLTSIIVALGVGAALAGSPVNAQTVEELKAKIAARKAEVAMLERQLRELEQEGGAAPVRAAQKQSGLLPPPSDAAPPPDDDDEGDRALERTLVREGALVLPAFARELAPHFSWAHWDSVQNPSIDNSYSAGLTFRMGLPWKSQVSVSVPYVVNDLSDGGTSSGLADAGFLFSKELLQETDTSPALLASIGWTSPTSTACCSSTIPYVSGFQGGLTASKRFDPLVAFASVSYFSSLSREVAGTTNDPSDIVGARLGASLAVTPSISLTGAMNMAFLTDPSEGDLPVSDSDRILSSIDLGVSTIVWPDILFNLTGQFGITGNVPDFRLITSVPVRF